MDIAIGAIGLLVALVGVYLAYLQLRRTPEPSNESKLKERLVPTKLSAENTEMDLNIQESNRPWIFFETEFLASPEVKESLIQFDNHEVFAVDNGIMLYLPPHFGVLRSEDIEVVITGESSFPLYLNDPEEKLLLRYCVKTDQKQIEGYLRRRAKMGATGKFRTKVGLTRIEKPNPRVGGLLRLHVSPLSFWTVQEFNRRMLDFPDDEIMEMKRVSLEGIFTSHSEVDILCPSALYVEVALITSDKKLVILEKNTDLSPLAARGFRWTCALEEGLEWSQFQTKLDLGRIVRAGAKTELGLKDDEIISVDFYGLALEHTHLNCAIIGSATLSISSDDLTSKVVGSKDFGRGYRYIAVDKVIDKLIGQLSETSSTWHPTGRLRALLAIYQISDIELERRRLKKRLSRLYAARDEGT